MSRVRRFLYRWNMAAKKKKKLDSEWKDRKIRFGVQKTNTYRYCIHAWNHLIGDGHGYLKTESHDYAYTDAGWSKAESKAREYADKGYTVTITRTGGI